MNINRDNYEEFFILYGDNELNSADRLKVETFVRENPDLQTEFSLLNQVRFTPNTAISFDDKEALFQPETHSSADETMLLYLDNELNETDSLVFEEALQNNTQLKSEFDQYKQTKLDPTEELVFPFKESLYKKEEKGRVFPIIWKRFAAAAAIVLAVSATALIVLNRNNKDENGALASGVVPGTEQISKPGNEFSKQDQPAASIDPEKRVNQEAVSGKEKNLYPSPKRIAQPGESRQQELARQHNDLPRPLYNPNVINNDGNNLIAMNEPELKSPVDNSKIIQTPDVTSTDNDAFQLASNRSSTIDENDDEEQPGKKSRFRGFFRKVTRTFEKNTNIKATDDEDRLLLGALAIKL